MARPWIAIGACVGVLTGCGSDGSAHLFGKSNGPTGGASFASGGTFPFGGSGPGGSPSTGGDFGGLGGSSNGGVVGGGGSIGAGGIVGSGGLAGNGGLAGDGGFVGSGGLLGDGGATATGGSISGGGAGGDTGPDPSNATVDCQGTPCATAGGNGCCVIVSTSGGTRTVFGTCVPPGSVCSIPFSTKAYCDGPEDCAPGSVCCGTSSTVPGLYTELACAAATSCTGADKQIMCHTGPDPKCASGVCRPTMQLPDGYGFCG